MDQTGRYMGSCFKETLGLIYLISNLLDFEQQNGEIRSVQTAQNTIWL